MDAKQLLEAGFSAAEIQEYQMLQNAGFSQNEITQHYNETPKKQTPSFAASDYLTPIAQGATLGAMDEIQAGAATGINKLSDALLGTNLTKGLPLGQTYDAYLNQARGREAQFREANPAVAAGGEILGAVVSPVNKLKMLGQAGSMGRAALEGGIYGFNQGQGGIKDRLTSALIGGGTGAGTSAAVKGLGKVASRVGNKFDDWARGSEQSALGITAADRGKASKKGLGKFIFENTGDHPMDKAIQTAKAHGVFSDGLDPDVLMAKNAQAVKGIANDVSNVLKVADDARTKPVKLKFSAAKNFIDERAVGAEKLRMKELLKDEAEAILEDFDGSIEGLQKIKVNLNSKSYGSDSNASIKKFYRQLTRDVKETIEREINDLADKGKIDQSLRQTVRKLNAEIGDLLNLQDIFTRRAAHFGADDPMKALIGTIKTTGGFGVPIIAGTTAGMPLTGLGIALGGRALVSPEGRMATASALRNAAPALRADPILSDPIARAVAGQSSR